MTVFLCGNGFDGILSGVYEVYASRLGPDRCRLAMKEEYEPELFCEYREVPVDPGKAEKVARTVIRRMSREAYVRLYCASLHKSSERADRILRFIVLGLSNGRRVLEMLCEPEVSEIFSMNRSVENEAHYHVEFARFEKMRSGLYYGEIGPENDILELAADHFADRFPDMNWALCDVKRKKAAIHSEKGALAIRLGLTEAELDSLRDGGRADKYTDLWKTFFHTIAIEERRNPQCQRNMLPLRYRKYMTEFRQEPDTGIRKFPAESAVRKEN